VEIQPAKRRTSFPFEDASHAFFFSINLVNSALFAAGVTELTVRGHSGICFGDISLPSLVVEVSLAVAWQCVVEYYWHRMQHLPFFYRHMHKHHHRFKSPEPFCDMNIHPLEAIGYYCILYSPSVVMRIHFFSFVVYMIVMGLCGVLDHSGVIVRIPHVYDTREHDLHHSCFDVNYSFPFPFMDMLHGTFKSPDDNLVD